MSMICLEASAFKCLFGGNLKKECHSLTDGKVDVNDDEFSL